MISGIAANESVQCFSYYADSGDFIGTLVKSLGRAPLRALKTIELSSGFSISFLKSADMMAAMQQMVALERLRLESFEIGRFPSLLDSASTLEELIIDDCIQNDDEGLRELAASISESKSLKVLHIVPDVNRHDGISLRGWRYFFNTIQQVPLRELHVNSSDNLSYSVIAPIAKYISINQRLEVVSFPCCLTRDNHIPTTNTLIQLASVLESHESILRVDISYLVLTYEGGLRLATQLGANSRIKRIDIGLFNESHLDFIPIILESSSLEELSISWPNVMSSETTRSMFYESARIVATVLQQNAALKVLSTGEALSDEKVDWSVFCNLLCDRSSIRATLESNHMIQALKFGNDTAPIEVLSLLHLNTNPNKRFVAQEKIISSHALGDINFTLSSLPTVASMVGSRLTDMRLSQLFSILRKVPHNIQNNT